MRTTGFVLASGLLLLSQASAEAVTIPPNTWVNLSAGSDPAAVADTGNCSGLPCGRSWFPMTYHAGAGKVVLFGGGVGGGCGSGYVNDVWVYDFTANAWTQRRPVDRAIAWPPGKDNHVMTFDSVNNRLWIMGGTCDSVQPGTGAFGYYDYSSNSFTQVVRPSEHGRTSGYPYVFDPAFAFGDGKIVAFSGEPSWQYDPGQRTSVFDVTALTWADKQPATRPPTREQVENVMVYDKSRKKFVLFGGQATGGASNLNDTWEYDLPTNQWTQITTPVSPPPRKKHTMVFDSKYNVVVMHGGQGSATALGDTWVYDGVARTWTQISSTGPVRALHGMVYDEVNDVTILYGGIDVNENQSGLTQTYAYRYQPATSSAPTAPSNATATATSSARVSVAWTDNSNNEDGFRIERKTGAGGTYAEIGTVGANVTTYGDSGLAAQTLYYYRIRAYNSIGNSPYSNETSATTMPAAPNPPPTPTGVHAQ